MSAGAGRQYLGGSDAARLHCHPRSVGDTDPRRKLVTSSCVCVCPCVDVMRPTSELSVMFVVWRVNSEDCLNDILCCVVYDSCADTHL